MVNMEYLIDVRTPEEFAEGHYTGAVNHELLLMQDGLLPEYPHDSSIYLYCRSGTRAEQAKEILESAGFSHVFNIGGYDPNLEL